MPKKYNDENDWGIFKPRALKRRPLSIDIADVLRDDAATHAVIRSIYHRCFRYAFLGTCAAMALRDVVQAAYRVWVGS